MGDKKQINERERLLYSISRFDHYFESVNNKTAVYAINITNKSDQILASFKGTVFVTTKKWIDE